MGSATLPLALGALLLPAAQASAGPAEEGLLARHSPTLLLDAREPGGPVAVDAFLAGARGAEAARAPLRVHGHAVRDRGRLWLQYWLFYPDNPQDRGIVRTGRHTGDWELVQVGLGAEQRPANVTFAQHKWRQACAWDEVRRSGGGPVGYVAHASHATYPRGGTGDRPWPEPNDDLRADGARVRPPVTVITADRPAWMASGERFGETRARWWIPGEAPSPHGPRFQGDRFLAPAAYHDGARSCASGPPFHPWWLVAPGAAVITIAILLLARGVSRRLVASPTA